MDYLQGRSFVQRDQAIYQPVRAHRREKVGCYIGHERHGLLLFELFPATEAGRILHFEHFVAHRVRRTSHAMFARTAANLPGQSSTTVAADANHGAAARPTDESAAHANDDAAANDVATAIDDDELDDA